MWKTNYRAKNFINSRKTLAKNLTSCFSVCICMSLKGEAVVDELLSFLLAFKIQESGPVSDRPELPAMMKIYISAV